MEDLISDVHDDTNGFNLANLIQSLVLCYWVMDFPKKVKDWLTLSLHSKMSALFWWKTVIWTMKFIWQFTYIYPSIRRRFGAMKASSMSKEGGSLKHPTSPLKPHSHLPLSNPWKYFRGWPSGRGRSPKPPYSAFCWQKSPLDF